MYTFKTDINQKEYENFLYENDASFMQEIGWANVKNNWKYITCGVYEDEKLVAAALILIRKITKGFNMFYIPRGYVIDFTNEKILKFMTDNIKKIAKKYKAYVVKLDPNFCINEYYIKNNDKKLNFYSKEYSKKHENLLKLGYKHTGFGKDLHSNLQPRYNMAISLIDDSGKKLSYEDLLNTLKSKVRYYTGEYHTKRGVHYSCSYDKKDIKEFVKLLECTEKNKNIHLRNEEYFNRMIDNFEGRICLLFGKVNLEEYLNYLKASNEKEEKIKQVKDLIKTDGKIITLSSALLLLPKTKSFKASEYLYAGNDLRLRELKVSTEIALEAAKISIENNCDYCNLGGVSGTLDDSLSNFKSKYNAVLLEFAGEYDLVISKFKYKFIKTFKPILKNLYKLIKK